jgi:hypothetical protein
MAVVARDRWKNIYSFLQATIKTENVSKNKF